jgi:peptide deformylase
MEITDADRVAIRYMKQICLESGGYALAANQIGYMRRIIVLVPDEQYDENDWVVMINPSYIPNTNEKKTPSDFVEGCLSFPGVRERTPRHHMIQVKWQDEQWNGHRAFYTGIRSIAIQHECEHLDGKTFIDDLSDFKKKRIIDKLKKGKKYDGRTDKT